MEPVLILLVLGGVGALGAGALLAKRKTEKKKAKDKAGLPRKERPENFEPPVELMELEEDDVYLLTKINARLEKMSDLNQRYARLREPIQSKLTLIRPVDSYGGRVLGEVTLGYPVGIREELNDFVILYRVKPPTFADYLAEKLGRLIGRGPKYAVLRVPKEPYTILFSDEYITVLAEALLNGPYGELIAVPLNGSLIDAKRWIALKKENTMLWEVLNSIALKYPQIVRAALDMNPRVKTYFGEKKKDDEGQKEKFGGLDLEFKDEFNPFARFFGER